MFHLANPPRFLYYDVRTRSITCGRIIYQFFANHVPEDTLQQTVSDKQNRAGILFLLAGGALCGTMGLFSTHLMEEGASSMCAAFLRLAAGALFVIPLVLLTAGPKGFRLTAKETGALALIGAVGLGLNNYFYMTCMHELGVASATIFDYTAPGFLVILSTIFFKDKLTVRKVLAVLLNFGGCAIMVTGGDFSTLSISPFGLVVGLLAGLTFALNNLFTRAFAKDIPSFVLTFYGFLFGAITLGLLVQPWHGLGFAATPVNLLTIAGYGIIPTALGFGGYYKGLLLVRDKALAPVLSSTENIVACLLGFFVLGEFFNLWKFVGIAMVLVAIGMISLADRNA